MKAFLFVEGPSDKLDLDSLWKPWSLRLGVRRHAIKVLPLDTKPNLLKKLGDRTAEKLVANDSDIVVGLPTSIQPRNFKVASRTLMR